MPDDKQELKIKTKQTNNNNNKRGEEACQNLYKFGIIRYTLPYTLLSDIFSKDLLYSTGTILYIL